MGGTPKRYTDISGQIRGQIDEFKQKSTNRQTCPYSCACTRSLCVHKILVHAQDSCACTTLLCMHNTLVHAQEPGLGPKKGAGPGPGTGPAPFLDPRPGSCACTKVLCMHKSVVHAQESCACIRISCADTILVQTQYTLLFLRYNKCCSETFPYQTWDFLVHLHPMTHSQIMS